MYMCTRLQGVTAPKLSPPNALVSVSPANSYSSFNTPVLVSSSVTALHSVIHSLLYGSKKWQVLFCAPMA